MACAVQILENNINVLFQKFMWKYVMCAMLCEN